jgi:NitT/TauT family transport system permease protein
MERPVLPAPHQIALDFWSSLVDWPLDSPRNLLFHVAVTGQTTLVGFVLGTLLGLVLAVLIVHSARWTARCCPGSWPPKRCRCWPLRPSCW